MFESIQQYKYELDIRYIKNSKLGIKTNGYWNKKPQRHIKKIWIPWNWTSIYTTTNTCKK